MKKWIQKHPGIVAAIVVGIGLLIVFFYWQRTITLSNTIETKLEDLPRGEAVRSAFYSDQLKEKEAAAYELVEQRLDDLQGGIIEFPEPLTGKEYQRVTMALEDEGYNYFYGLCEIPMTEDNVYLLYDSDDVSKVTDPIIAKAVLFVTTAEGISIAADYADDGTVKNLDEIIEAYQKEDPAKKSEVEKTLKATEAALDEIMAGLPEGYGEKRTVDYFLSWLDENMTTETSVASGGETYYGMEGLIDGVLIYNQLASLTKGAAGPVGYAKILSELCNRAGMESHIVFGTWGRKGLTSESYVLCAVRMNDQWIYVDASGGQGKDMGGLRYMTEEGAMNHMDFADYFSYEG